MSRIRELRERRLQIVEEARRKLPTNGSLTAEQRRHFDQAMDAADELKNQIDHLEREAELGTHEADLRSTRGRPPERQPGADIGATAEERRYRQAFGNFLRHGLYPDQHFRGLDEAELAVMLSRRAETRDMGVGTGNLGGFFVPQGFIYDVEVAMKFISELYANANVMDTSTGNPLPHPTANDTTVVAEIVGEGAQVTNADVMIGQITFFAYKFSTKMVKVSIELAQDSAFDMESFLSQQFAVRLARGLNPFLTAGTGTAQPTGIMTPATAGVGGSSGTAVIGDDNATTPSPQTQVGYTDLVNLEHSVDPLYRPNGKFMMHDTTLRFIKTLKDKYGRPLWVPGVASNAPDTILGYRYLRNNDMATLATGNKTVLFGALDRFMIRRVKELTVLRLVERFADFGQIAFIGFARYDSNLLDAGTHPVKYLQQA